MNLFSFASTYIGSREGFGGLAHVYSDPPALSNIKQNFLHENLMLSLISAARLIEHVRKLVVYDVEYETDKLFYLIVNVLASLN